MENGQDIRKPLSRDVTRFRFLSPDTRPKLPEGLSGTLDVISTYELVHGLAGKQEARAT